MEEMIGDSDRFVTVSRLITSWMELMKSQLAGSDDSVKLGSHFSERKREKPSYGCISGRISFASGPVAGSFPGPLSLFLFSFSLSLSLSLSPWL